MGRKLLAGDSGGGRQLSDEKSINKNRVVGAGAVPISLPVIRVGHGLGLCEQSWIQESEGGLAP